MTPQEVIRDLLDGLGIGDPCTYDGPVDLPSTILDALHANGCVVVQLPARDMEGEHSTPEFSHEMSAWMLFGDNPGQIVQACRCGDIELMGSQSRLTPKAARDLAAALLAAAIAAEEQTA